MLSETSRTVAVGELATVIPPAPEMLSKKDLLEPRLNLRLAPELMMTVEGVARVPGILGLSVSGFRGSLTFYLGAGPPALVSRMAEHMKRLLPVGAAVGANT